MASCEIIIRRERSVNTYLPGESVDGAVLVHVRSRCSCRKLTLLLQWETSGFGNNDRVVADSRVLAEGDTWEAGEEQEFEFSFEVPEAPTSYQGEHLSVRWSLVAHADLAWAVDAESADELEIKAPNESQLTLRPATYEESILPRIVDPPLRGKGLKYKSPLSSIFWSLVLLIPGVLLLSSFLRYTSSDLQDWSNPGFLMVMAVPSLLILLGFWGIIGAVRRIMSNISLGRITVELRPDPQTKTIHALLSNPQRETDKITSLDGALQVIEWARKSDSDSGSSSREAVLHSEVSTFTQIDGEPGHYQAPFALPENLPPSFKSADNGVLWQMTLYAKMKRGLEWGNHFQFTARYRPAKATSPYR